MKSYYFTSVFFIFFVINVLGKDEKVEDKILYSIPDKTEISERGYENWPVWSGGAITYPTKTYSSTEYCYFIEGEALIVTDKGTEYIAKPGVLIVFQKGCTCTWYVKKPIKKHYKFE